MQIYRNMQLVYIFIQICKNMHKKKLTIDHKMSTSLIKIIVAQL